MDIRIENVQLTNFKCYSTYELAIGGKELLITGQNGIGKSTIFDAVIWCLTGKLPNGKSDSSAIRTIGMPVDVCPEVSVTLSADGETTVYTRRLEPTYTGRGADKAYKGDQTICAIDGVPKGVREYEDAVNALFPVSPQIWLDLLSFCDDTKFSADDRRKVLIDAFGNNITDEDVRYTNFKFEDLFEAKGKLSVDDFKTTQKEVEKNCTAELGRGKTPGTLQSRIDEAARSIIRPDLSVMNIELAISNLEEQIRQASVQDNSDIAARQSKANTDYVYARNAVEKYIESAREAKTRALQEQIDEIDRKRIESSKAYTDAQMRYQATQGLVANIQGLIDRAEAEFSALDAQQADVMTVCPTCGHKIAKAKVDAAISKFHEDKAIKLEKLCEEVERAKERLTANNTTLNDLASELKALQAVASETSQKRTELVKQMNLAKMESVDVPCELQTALDAAKAELESIKTLVTTDNADILKELTEKLKAEQALLSEAQANERQRQRIKELQERQRTVAAELSKAQEYIALCDEFILAKARFIEATIASHFDGVTFELFSLYKNGEIKNSCVPLMDGKPFSVLSFSQKTVASVAILNGLSKHFGFTAPVLIDNASEMDGFTTAKLETAGQKIIIKVSDGNFTVESM